MLSLWDRLRAGLGGREKPDEARLRQALDWSISQIEPRLRFHSDYPRRYQTILARALAHCDDLAQRMQPPLAVDRTSYTRNPITRALFARNEEIPEVLGKSQAVRNWLARSEAEEFVGLLGVRLRQKQVFAPDLEGDQVRHDVAQQVLLLEDHTLTVLGADEAQVRTLLAREFLDSLLEQVRARVRGLRERHQTMNQSCSQLLAAMRTGAATQGELEVCRKELAQVSAALELARYPDHFDAVLQQPEQHVGLQHLRVQVDSLGVCRLGSATPGHTEINLCELTGRDRRRWLVTLVRCRRGDVSPPSSLSDRLQEAGRWLAI